MTAIAGTVSSFKSMADGCIRIAVDFREAESKQAKGMLCDVGASVGIARLIDEQHQSPDVKQAEQDQSVDAKALYGEQARTLRLSSFFRTPAVWEAIGTDDEFRAWIQEQTSCLDYTSDWDSEKGRNVCEAAHVRRAGESGTAHKGTYACVPLTHEQHQLQHTKGELAVLSKYRPGEVKTVEHAKAWFDGQRIKYVQAWGWAKLKADLGYEHWNELPPSVLQAWAGQKSLGHLLPSGYVQ